MYFSILVLSAYLLAIFSQTQAQPLRHNHYLHQRHKHSHHHHQPELLPRALPVKRTLSSLLGGSGPEYKTFHEVGQLKDPNSGNDAALQADTT